MTKKQKKMLYRIIAALALVLVLKLLPPLPASVELLLYCIPYLVVGWDVLRKALLGIKNRQPFDAVSYTHLGQTNKIHLSIRFGGASGSRTLAPVSRPIAFRVRPLTTT